VKAHTGEGDEASKINERADTTAKAAHESTATIKLPPITAWMRKYVVWAPDVGYIPDNWVSRFTAQMTTLLFKRETVKQQRRLQDPQAASATDTPSYFYHKAPIGHTCSPTRPRIPIPLRRETRASLAIILTSRIAGAYLRDAGITYPINDGVELRRTRR